MNRPGRDRRARDEAADWFARLNARTVSVSDLEAFRAWRAEPAHRDAYEAMEAAWRQSGELRDDPDIQAALAEAVVRPQRRSRPRPAWILAGALASAAVVVAGVWITNRPQSYGTEVGERRVVRLADGSELQLDTGSLVTVRFQRDQRRLTLERGQALFQVAHDQDRPFVVHAGEVRVTATGTLFDVRRDAGGVRITLVEGGVVVTGQDERRVWRLEPNEQLIASPAEMTSAPRRVDVRAVTAWTEGRLEFDAVPLAAALDEVNRYEERPITLGQGVDGTLPISGAFDAGHGLAFAEAAARIYSLDVRTTRAGPRLEARAAENRLRPPG